jgi:hypothetical protein
MGLHGVEPETLYDSNSSIMFAVRPNGKFDDEEDSDE